ncbi:MULTISPECIES: hypothetical protein [unclassified Rhizobium]|uniref:hypothetical protein n=1 Tax=unclassified Rhizobium TaxID=2613769 RepID=UPI0024788949|nr:MULTISPECIES: hypothetical protein [unclassified Rhizobium]MDH7804226.1 hypothetical protein [Rhizobium sp. AN70]
MDLLNVLVQVGLATYWEEVFTLHDREKGDNVAESLGNGIETAGGALSQKRLEF